MEPGNEAISGQCLARYEATGNQATVSPLHGVERVLCHLSDLLVRGAQLLYGLQLLQGGLDGEEGGGREGGREGRRGKGGRREVRDISGDKDLKCVRSTCIKRFSECTHM